MALILGQLGYTPLRIWQWALLFLGFTQLPAPVLLIAVGWFFAFAFRGRTSIQNAWIFNLFQLFLVGLTLIFVSVLYGAIYTNLLDSITMSVKGAGSSNYHLNWYVDRIQGTSPEITFYSTHPWIWKGIC